MILHWFACDGVQVSWFTIVVLTKIDHDRVWVERRRRGRDIGTKLAPTSGAVQRMFPFLRHANCGSAKNVASIAVRGDQTVAALACQ